MTTGYWSYKTNKILRKNDYVDTIFFFNIIFSVRVIKGFQICRVDKTIYYFDKSNSIEFNKTFVNNDGIPVTYLVQNNYEATHAVYIRKTGWNRQKKHFEITPEGIERKIIRC